MQTAKEGAEPFVRCEALSHDLTVHFDALRAIRTRKALERSPLYASIKDELSRVLDGVECGDHRDVEQAGLRPLAGLRAVAWNIRRGADFEGVLGALRDVPELAGADVYLLAEVDDGMGRSGNRNVARDLARALGTSYAFGVSYIALEDDIGENEAHLPSTLALAGAAVLSRRPIRRAENVLLPELRDKFSSSEKRLGRKRAVLAEIDTAEGPLACAACHLDSNASPAQRAQQLSALIDRADGSGAPRVLLGGDLNTSTYDVSTTPALARDLLHKLFVTGFNGTVDNYMTPDRLYETPVFDVLREQGFSTEGFNDRARPTCSYDLNDRHTIEKTRSKVGALLTRYLRYRLRPWNGVCAARLDWFAGRGLTPRAAGVVDPRGPNGRAVSDHSAIWVELG